MRVYADKSKSFDKKRSSSRIQHSLSKNHPVKKSKKYIHPMIDYMSYLQKGIGNRAVEQLWNAGVIQAKFGLSKSGDKLEQEADRVSDQVMNMSDNQEHSIQQKPLTETITPIVQQKTAHQQAEVTAEVESGIKSMKGQGQSLSDSERSFFESRFGTDFSGVKIHNNANAAELADSIRAKAFTTGSDIFFGRGESPQDKKLMAHELTHVVQQTGSIANHGNKLTINRKRKKPKKKSIKELQKKLKKLQQEECINWQRKFEGKIEGGVSTKEKQQGEEEQTEGIRYYYGEAGITGSLSYKEVKGKKWPTIDWDIKGQVKLEIWDDNRNKRSITIEAKKPSKYGGLWGFILINLKKNLRNGLEIIYDLIADDVKKAFNKELRRLSKTIINDKNTYIISEEILKRALSDVKKRLPKKFNYDKIEITKLTGDLDLYANIKWNCGEKDKDEEKKKKEEEKKKTEEIEDTYNTGFKAFRANGLMRIADYISSVGSQTMRLKIVNVNLSSKSYVELTTRFGRFWIKEWNNLANVKILDDGKRITFDIVGGDIKNIKNIKNKVANIMVSCSIVEPVKWLFFIKTRSRGSRVILTPYARDGWKRNKRGRVPATIGGYY